jgi:hypothetical protein
MDVWCVYVFILCLRYPVLRLRPCVGLITRPRSPTVCKMIMKLKKKQRPGPKGTVDPVKKKRVDLHRILLRRSNAENK